jgi:hypothetical protein
MSGVSVETETVELGELVETIQGLGLPEFLLGLAVALVVTGIAGYWGYTRFRAYRIVKDTPTSRIRSAPQGYVEIKGQFEEISEAKARQAPFSGQPCVWYQVKIQEEQEGGEDDTDTWRTIFEETDPRPCLLGDGTGRCLVLASEADMRVAVESDTYYEDGILNDPPEPLKHADTGLFEGNLRFVEERIAPGAKGYVVGRFTTVDSEDGAAGEGVDGVNRVTQVLTGWRDDYMADVAGRPDKTRPNMSGLDDDQKRLLPRAAVAWARQWGDADDVDSVITASGESRRPFIVGCGEEASVARRLFWKAVAGMGAFVLAGSGLAAFVLIHVGVIG